MPRVEVSFINICGGVTGITLQGRIRVELFLMDWLPLVGGALVCFTNPPSFDFDLTGWANIGDIPGNYKGFHLPKIIFSNF